MSKKHESEEKRSSVECYMLKHEIEKLEAKRSFNMSTSLVTLYIPPGTRLPDIHHNSKMNMERLQISKIKAQEKRFNQLFHQFYQE